MSENIQDTLNERGKAYGEFHSHARITQEIKDAMCDSPAVTYERLRPFHKEALDMIAHKIGRILNGDPNFVDSWRDIAGYATLVMNKLLEQEQVDQKVEQEEVKKSEEKMCGPGTACGDDKAKYTKADPRVRKVNKQAQELFNKFAAELSLQDVLFGTILRPDANCDCPGCTLRKLLEKEKKTFGPDSNFFGM